MDGLGSINWWGFTPAIDLLSKMDKDEIQDCEPAEVTEELHILVVGAGDCRHIFKTLAQFYRHSVRTINFYVMESSVELYARHMLFMKILLEPLNKLGLQEKTELFLELHGNSLVRQQSMDYVQTTASEYVNMVTNLDYQQLKFPVIDLSHLKFKERDMLEGIFKFWRTSSFSQFDISKCWDLRLRQYLGVRYDAIPNVFDWDFHMKLVEKEASIINVRNYNRWRHKGVAYELREGTYDVPNRTLASGMVFKNEGERIARRGYWGDIVVGPYISFGIESENKTFFKKSNNMLTKTSEDVAQFNVISMMHEVAYQCRYEPSVVEEDYNNEKSNVQELNSISEAEAPSETRETAPESKASSESDDLLPVNFAKIHFLPINSTPDLIKKSKFYRLFNIVYISNSNAHVLTPELADTTFADGASVILDTVKFLIELKEEQTSEYLKKIVSIAESIGCKVNGKIDSKNSAFAKFIYNRTDKSVD